VIANRLAPLLPQLVGPHQSAFVRGRCLHDNFMMVQGTARKLHSSKQPAILLKLDITKAFDTVDWSFLLEVVRKMCFGDRLLAYICALLSTASTCVLLNGSPGARVANRRGLWQGDPPPLSSAVHPDHGGSSLHARESDAGGPVSPPC
jgi:hypothetical protein